MKLRVRFKSINSMIKSGKLKAVAYNCGRVKFTDDQGILLYPEMADIMESEAEHIIEVSGVPDRDFYVKDFKFPITWVEEVETVEEPKKKRMTLELELIEDGKFGCSGCFFDNGEPCGFTCDMTKKCHWKLISRTIHNERE